MNQSKNWILCLFAVLFTFGMSTEAWAQKKKKNKKQEEASNSIQFEEDLYDHIEWRGIGPFRGGRSAAVCGVEGEPNLFYFGATGGGVWKTEDGGRSWSNISDGYFGGSVGAISVSSSDPNVIYVGGGEVTVRGNVSHGYGMWKSVDAGKSWEQIGLEDSRHISRISVHPDNSDIVYAAVLGDLYQDTETRGVYKSIDGGESWERVLFSSPAAGAVDLCIDPKNPRILYASTWDIRRTPYSLSSGGEGSALWKSTDSGVTWTKISDNEGMPKGILGIIGITVSPVNNQRLWAIVENKDGGVFRSEDGGNTWKRINQSRSLRQRAWYYSRIYADPMDEEVVYVMNVRYHKSKDGGQNFKAYNAPHGDHHDLWIDPSNPKRMIIADDGGAQVSYDGGLTWSTYHNQPTAQFYRVTTDNAFPYRIYVAQQDNSTLRIDHRSTSSYITEDNWEETAGCECGHIAIDPEDNDIVYGGCYDGFLERLDHNRKLSRNITVWPDNPMGHGAEGMKYRFQWNFPIFFSPHNSKKLYTASNHLHVSYDEGQSWQLISPDLTRNDSSKLVSSGGPITKDNTSVEYYCTIFAAMESPLEEGVIWVGSDDGLMHITKDGGANWENITPKGLPEWAQINSLEVHPTQKGSCYIAATRYKSGDYSPYLFKTEDYGKSWKRIDSGIDAQHFTRVVRADPEREGLLYAGTESGVYISFDDGVSWKPFQLNLPIVPITDMTVKQGNLIVATQGRSIWMIDDLSVLHQLNKEVRNRKATLYKPMDSYRMRGGQAPKSTRYGQNHPGGVQVHYFIPNLEDSTVVSLTFLDGKGNYIKTYSTDAKEKSDKLKVESGVNTFKWNMRYESAEKFDGMILWWASLGGPTAVPGKYSVELRVGDQTFKEDFNILKDPRLTASDADLQAQFDFIQEINETVTKAHESITEMRDIKEQMNNYSARLKDKEYAQQITDKVKEIEGKIDEVEKALYQTKNRSRQDPLNFPIRLTNKLAHLNSLTASGDFAPTDQAVAVKDELSAKIDAQLTEFDRIKKEDISALNKLIKDLAIDGIILND